MNVESIEFAFIKLNTEETMFRKSISYRKGREFR